jgi:hypothetical protein
VVAQVEKAAAAPRVRAPKADAKPEAKAEDAAPKPTRAPRAKKPVAKAEPEASNEVTE